ncbi:MAG: hypothetical protein V2A73_19225, partial [Pseudomonadota bacterium]
MHSLPTERKHLPKQLAPGARFFDLGDEALFLAWEVAQLASDLGEADSRALVLLLLATMAGDHEGNSYLLLPRRDAASRTTESTESTESTGSDEASEDASRAGSPVNALASG